MLVEEQKWIQRKPASKADDPRCWIGCEVGWIQWKTTEVAGREETRIQQNVGWGKRIIPSEMV